MGRSQWIAVAALLTSVAATASAQVFNSGIPSGYTCTGTCATSGANGVVTLAPGGGTQFGYVSTVGAPTGNPLNISGTTNGSLLRSDLFTSTSGQTLSFSFNFVTTDGSEFSDYAFVRLLNTTDPTSSITLFTARTRPPGEGNVVPGFGLPGLAPGVTLSPASTPIIAGGPAFIGLGSDSGRCFNGTTQGCGFTGWIGASYLVQMTAAYQIEFGVFNFSDQLFQSVLAFDFTTGLGGTPIVSPGPPIVGVIPEPGTYSLMVLGLVGVAMMARRRRAPA